jgi:glycosyltransferase involved in cell wall biosynthesis
VPGGRAGLLVNPQNPNDIARAVVKILRNMKTATRMGRYGRMVVSEKFNWDSVAEVFEKVINSGVDKEGTTVTKPFFSVITCTRNSQKYLPRNIKSVKSQTFKDYEHFFVDSFSTDKTLSIEKRYAKTDPRAKVILIKKTGISRAMNEGIKYAKGEYIIHLHSDDYFHHKSTLERVYKYLRESGFPDWIYGKIQVVEENGKKVGMFPRHKLLQISSISLLRLFNFVPHQSVFVKKKIFKKFGYFDTRLSSNMDYDFWLRISSKTRWLFFNKIISNYSIHSDAQSSAKRNRFINNLNEDMVARKRLNTSEYLLHKLVKVPIDFYNKTLR